MRRDPEPPPRYDQIFRALRESIASGRPGVGEPLPTEAELCAEFSASRFTIREALRRLVELGMIGRRKGHGSFVISAAPRPGYVQSMRSLAELFQYARETTFEVNEAKLVPLGREVAEIVRVEPGALWLCVEGVRRDESGPICYTRVVVDGRFAPLLPDVATLRTPIYAAVEERGGATVAEAVQEMSSVRMPAAFARALEVGKGDQAVLVQRRYIDPDGNALLMSRNWHPASRFRFTMRIQRGDFSPASG